MVDMLTFLSLWGLASCAVALLVGRFIRAGNPEPDDEGPLGPSVPTDHRH